MLKEIKSTELLINPMNMIGKDWWILTSGNDSIGYNTILGPYWIPLG